MGSRPPFLSLNYFCFRIRSFNDATPCFLSKVPSCISLRTLKSVLYCFSMVFTKVSLRFWRNGPLVFRERYPDMPGASGALRLAIVILLSRRHYYDGRRLQINLVITQRKNFRKVLPTRICTRG